MLGFSLQRAGSSLVVRRLGSDQPVAVAVRWDVPMTESGARAISRAIDMAVVFRDPSGARRGVSY